MRYDKFYPGDKVITIVEYDDVPVGSVGRVVSKWAGTAYSVKISNGSFRWLSDYEVSLTDPNRHKVIVGDTIVVTLDDHQHPYAKLGDRFTVAKVAYDVDYYMVIIYDQPHWFGGFQLAPHK